MILRPRSPRQSILESVGNAALNSPLPIHKRETLTDSILEGSFYEIDHSKLPPEAPPMLLVIRAVMVTAKSEHSVTIRYPSNLSLEAYFGNLDRIGLRPELYPELDAKYVMGPKLAIEVLRRQIPSQEFDNLRQSKYFWSIKCSRVEQLPMQVTYNFKAKHGPCFSKLQCSSIKGWASTKFVAYLPSSAGCNDLAKKEVKIGDSRDGKEIVKKEEHYETRDGKEIVKKEEDYGTKVQKVEDHVTKDQKVEDHETKDQLIIQYSRKRKSGRPLLSKNKKSKRISEPNAIVVKAETEANIDAVYVERWTLKRYDSAAIQLLEVLKKNGAVHGNPIPRAQLRTEARKKVGDTGLLDHLLKHLAGKVVPRDGIDRLRRRCDAEGKMEYWIESADLVNIRREAGVNDPYWIPPPGWKLGDKLDLSSCMCCQEVKMLKEELNIMRRKVEKQNEDRNEQAITLVMSDSNTTSSGRVRGGNLNKKEIYDVLMKKKLLLEEQWRQVSLSLMELKEPMEMEPNKTKTTINPQLMSSTCQSLPVEELSDSHGEVNQEKRLILKLKQCKRLENMSNTSSCQEVDHSMQDIMGLITVSGSPLSTTTS